MARLTLCTLCFFGYLNCISQPVLDAYSKLTLASIEKSLGDRQELSANSHVALHPIDGQLYLATTARKSADFNSRTLPSGFMVGSELGEVITLHIPINSLSKIDSLKGVRYLQVARNGAWFMKDIMDHNGARRVHLGDELPAPCQGEGVIIGLPEVGIDFTHPVFYDSSGTNLRILAAWDQHRLSGNSPQAGYGAEYVGMNELLAAESDTFNIYGGYNTHGTGTGSMAASGGAVNEYHGAAPKSELLFASIELNEAQIIDAASWMKEKADEEGKPLVLSLSFGGLHFGPLDGTSNLSAAMDALVDDGVPVVAATSNDAFINMHVEKAFNGDTLRNQIDINNYSIPDLYGARLIMWGEESQPFSFWIEVHDSTGLVLESPLYNTETSSAILDSMLVDGSDTVFFKSAIDDAHPLNQAPHANLQIKNENTAWTIVLGSTAPDGTVHYWNMDAYNHGGSLRGATINEWEGNGYHGNNNYCTPDPAIAEKVITCGGYHNSGSLEGQRDDNGPKGPTLDGRVKPDISSVSVNVTTAYSSFCTFNWTSVDNASFNGKTYDFVERSGISYTSPVVAGAAALLLEAYPSATPELIKEVLFETATVDNFTGQVPSNDWGWGKLNVWEAVNRMKEIAGIEHLKTNDHLVVYPNPASDLIQVQTETEGPVLVQFYDLAGKVVGSKYLSTSDRSIDVSSLARGTYVIEAEGQRNKLTITR